MHQLIIDLAKLGAILFGGVALTVAFGLVYLDAADSPYLDDDEDDHSYHDF